jgi:hypothetical protein
MRSSGTSVPSTTARMRATTSSSESAAGPTRTTSSAADASDTPNRRIASLICRHAVVSGVGGRAGAGTDVVARVEGPEDLRVHRLRPERALLVREHRLRNRRAQVQHARDLDERIDRGSLKNGAGARRTRRASTNAKLTSSRASSSAVAARTMRARMSAALVTSATRATCTASRPAEWCAQWAV